MARVRSFGILVLIAVSCGGSEVSTVLPEPPAALPLSSPAPEPRNVPAPIDIDGPGTSVVRSLTDAFVVYERPAPGLAHVEEISSANPWYQQLALPVYSTFDDSEGNQWLEVQLPDANGASGWIRRDGVTASVVDQRIVIDLSDRTLIHFRRGELLKELSVGVGTDQTPTTTGKFFVWALVDYADDSGPYGAFALGLSGFSEVLTDWPGGGRMAIHGTIDPNDIGVAVSHGCIRVLNDQMRWLTRVPLGTPVFIRS
jgi:lipoprotein-anchoring transpeptidase ErfK/SrfK